MSKILRKVAKIFGSSAGANQIAEFGSLGRGISDVHNRSGRNPVALELPHGLVRRSGGRQQSRDRGHERALLPLRLSDRLSHPSRVPEYDATTTYYTGSLVNSAGSLYRSVVDNNTGNSLSNSSYWALAAGLSPGVGSNGTITVNPSANPFYLIPSTSDGANIHVHTAQGPILIFLPSAALTEKITIKDIDGFANINPITIVVCPSFAIGSNGRFRKRLERWLQLERDSRLPRSRFSRRWRSGAQNSMGSIPEETSGPQEATPTGRSGREISFRKCSNPRCQGMSKISAGSPRSMPSILRPEKYGLGVSIPTASLESTQS